MVAELLYYSAGAETKKQKKQQKTKPPWCKLRFDLLLIHEKVFFPASFEYFLYYYHFLGLSRITDPLGFSSFFVCRELNETPSALH